LDSGNQAATDDRRKLVELHNVTVDLPVFSVSARSLRRSMLNLPVGGQLLKNRQEQVVVRALEGISFTLYEGDRLGLIGHNGSGKSTLLRTVGGIYAPSAGVAEVAGEVFTMLDVATGLDLEASGEENVRLMARYRGVSKKDALAALPEIEEFTELGSFFKLPVKTYSQGMLSRLVFGVATSFEPDVLLMDEWISAGDEHFVQKAEARMAKFVSAARVLILATHDHGIIRRWCNKVARMDGGRIVAFGTPEEVLD
jgi:lipopolysaccharide transport system ATP-binding protein